ncbi:hypothetical protein [uncultured Cellulomonas sp.]|uniref:hypothetical protein n=1 Tax=uncultured Cellulomonas sp. TaxID=189682 RepID=UPI00262A9B91|nr:hypothetical protein [uncultured Cellulomonas sp.]
MTEPSQERAAQGSVAEHEVPRHTVDPDTHAEVPLEETTAYELAVEDGAPLPPDGPDPGAGDRAPDFRAPQPRGSQA